MRKTETYGNVKKTREEKAKKLYEIADALEEWRKYNGSEKAPDRFNYRDGMSQ